MRSLLSPSFLLALFAACPTDAARFPFTVRTATSGLFRRADISGQSTRNVSVPVTNIHNAEYISNITVGGKSVAVMLDTGSSDLWVTGTGYNSAGTGKSATLSYAVGKAAGEIRIAQVQLDDYIVPDQAFMLVNDTSSFSMDIAAQGFQGLIGLGPDTGSIIRKKYGEGRGDSVLFRIFAQNHTTDNYITFLLDRRSDPGNTITGQFTISELVPEYQNISSTTKLTVDHVAGGSLIDENQHWQVLTDKDMGIIGPDGQPIRIKSMVPKAPKGQLVAVIDSGFTFSQVPRAVSDAIYGRVQGAVYDTRSQFWTVPCGQYLNIAFNFGGVTYPIHPLDTVNSDFDYRDANGNSACIGSFQPITSAFSLLGNYDMILGMGFMRNAYTLFNFGNWIENSNVRDKPYIQMLPLTNVNSARTNFVRQRLNGTDTIASPQYTLLPPEQMQHSPVSDKEKKAKYQAYILSRWPYIFVGCFIFLLLMIGCCVWRCCCRKRRHRSSKTNKSPYEEKDDETDYMALGSRSAYQSQYSLHGRP